MKGNAQDNCLITIKNSTTRNDADAGSFEQSSENGQGSNMSEDETSTVSDIEAATEEGEVDAAEVSTETGLLSIDEDTNTASNRKDKPHDDIGGEMSIVME